MNMLSHCLTSDNIEREIKSSCLLNLCCVCLVTWQILLGLSLCLLAMNRQAHLLLYFLLLMWAAEAAVRMAQGYVLWRLKWGWPVWWLHGLRLLPQHGGSSRRSMHGFSPCCLSRVSVLNPFVEGWIVVFWCECFICPEAAGALPVWCTIMPPVFSTAMSTLTCHACLLRSFRE